MKRIIVILSDEQYQDLKRKSYENNLPMTEIVRQALRKQKNIRIHTKEPLTIRRLTTEEWSDRVRTRDQYICQHCKTQLDHHTAIAHHIVPRNQGGKNLPDNGITLCRDCHIAIHRRKKT
jgi:5-methylcytosine-specific restriction endonuclease McrA